MQHWWIASALAAGLLLGPGSARAAPPDVELFGGIATWFPFLDTLYDASYVPSRVNGINQLFQEPDPRSRAEELLALQGERSVGFGLGVNVYPHRNFGFQFLLDRAEVGISGENPPHEVDLTYDTIAFPSTERVVRELSFSFDRPDTDGDLDELALSFNAAARFSGSGPLGGAISGGLTYFRFEGAAEPIDAFAAWLGGHAVVFSDVYEMTASFDSASALGINLGGELDVSLGEGVALFLDGRVFYAPETETELRLEDFLSDDVVGVPLERIEGFLALPAVEIDPGFFRILFGVKWKL